MQNTLRQQRKRNRKQYRSRKQMVIFQEQLSCRVEICVHMVEKAGTDVRGPEKPQHMHREEEGLRNNELK